MTYKVIQRTNGETAWCIVDSAEDLCRFCQYVMDGTNPEELKDFWIVRLDDGGAAVWWTWLPDFCRTHGIRKRTFEEKMGMKKS